MFVILFTVGGVCFSGCWDNTPPGPCTPPRPCTPRLVQSMLGDTVNARAVRILLECNLVERCIRSIYECGIQVHYMTYSDLQHKSVVQCCPELNSTRSHKMENSCIFPQSRSNLAAQKPRVAAPYWPLRRRHLVLE